MTTSLLTLPGEILNLIDLPSQDISALSQVCKPLHQRMLPRLYEAVVLTWTMELTGNDQIHFFVRSLLENQCLFTLVKHFRCIGETDIKALDSMRSRSRSPGPFWEKGVTKTLEDDELVTKAIKIVYLAGLPLPLAWMDDLDLGNTEAFLALILSQLPQLRTLHLDAHFITDNEFIDLLFNHVSFPNNQSSNRRHCLSIFANLHHVEIISPVPELELPTEVSINGTQVMSLFYLPAIETLDLFVLNRRDMFSWPTDNPPCASHLRTLNLPDCEIDEKGLKRVLAVTPKLKKLSYHRLSGIQPDKVFDQIPYLDLTILGKALVQVRTTLRHLSLSILFYAKYTQDVDDNPHHGTIGPPISFKSFDKLEYLEIPFVILFGQFPSRFPGQENLLPQCLRHLCLRDDMATSTYYEWTASVCLTKIMELLAHRDRFAPCLESITLRLRESKESEWDEGQQDELRDLCSVAGLDCSISKVFSEPWTSNFQEED
ncbi:hypothetical protein MMC31_003733 [Peltigera leucophlebia]|nr:hypothetical protein [Peltigera leucophlebia]